MTALKRFSASLQYFFSQQLKLLLVILLAFDCVNKYLLSGESFFTSSRIFLPFLIKRWSDIWRKYHVLHILQPYSLCEHMRHLLFPHPQSPSYEYRLHHPVYLTSQGQSVHLPQFQFGSPTESNRLLQSFSDRGFPQRGPFLFQDITQSHPFSFEQSET